MMNNCKYFFKNELFHYNPLANPLDSKRTCDKQYGRMNWKRAGFKKGLYSEPIQLW